MTTLDDQGHLLIRMTMRRAVEQIRHGLASIGFPNERWECLGPPHVEEAAQVVSKAAGIDAVQSPHPWGSKGTLKVKAKS